MRPGHSIPLTGLVVILGIFSAAHGAETNKAEMKNLSSVDEFKDQFNADAGKRRLLLLLSPT